MPYYTALEEADAAWKNGDIDVSVVEALMEEMLAKQLAHVLDRAKDPEPIEVDRDPTLH